MWDPDLRDTTEPLLCVDLKAFALEGDPQLNARTSGRAMDWTTSQQFLRYLNDVVRDLNIPLVVTRQLLNFWSLRPDTSTCVHLSCLNAQLCQ